MKSARPSPVTSRRWAIALVIATALLLVLFVMGLSFSQTNGHQHGHQQHLQPALAHHRRPYLHMVAKPSDAFTKPVKGTWVYFVAVSPNKRHYLHCAFLTFTV